MDFWNIFICERSPTNFQSSRDHLQNAVRQKDDKNQILYEGPIFLR